MRIIAGKWRGRPLETPPGMDTRPTADRVRETLFNMLASRVGDFEGLRVADLFAGTGALGFEALSRGAAHATFVERDQNAIAAIRRNAEKLGTPVELFSGSALSLPRAEPFDLVFADPPYEVGAGTAVIESVTKSGWLAAGGWISIETAGDDRIDPGKLALEAEGIVGRARLWLLRDPSMHWPPS